jgi:hypothetical protein
MVFLSVPIESEGQLSVESEECACLDYPDIENTGRFEEAITLNTTPGTIIKVNDFSNFYDITSPEDMYVNYPDFFEPVEGPAGTFKLSGLRREGLPWSMVINEITMSDTVRTTIMSEFICSYPDTTIFGDLNNCIGDIETYYVDLEMSEINSIEWTLSGGGTILGRSDSNFVKINWGSVIGVNTLTVVVEGVDGSTEANDYCEFETSVDIALVDEESETIACTNEINLSIDGLCEFMVTPDLVLRSFPYPATSFDVELTDLEADTIIDGNMIFGGYIGKRIGVSIIHDCSGNSCWGTILLKDEVAPPLVCPSDTIVDCDAAIDPLSLGFPVPESAFVEQVDFRTFVVTNYDLCGPVILTYKDVTQPLECDAEFGALVERTWTITDKAGNSNFCSFLISIYESEFEEIVFPEDYDDELGTQSSLAACGDWEKLENGAPAPSVTGMPVGAICLNVHVEFEDLIFYKCSEENIDKTFKVWRKWTVVEHCPDGMDSIHIQIISVRDTVAPIVVVPESIMVGTTPHKCGADIPIPEPEVEDCSIWEYTIGYKVKDENGLPSSETFFHNVVKNLDGTFTITDIPGGEKELWIIYTVIDVCGNSTIATSELKIIDDEEPVTICDEFTFVSLDENGVGYAGIKSFDDGSWDNCGIDKIEIRRMESFSCGSRNDWGQKVEFCCLDVGKDVLVSLRVIDKSGNSNTCMVIAEVQDNLPPEFTYVPKDTTIQCENNLDDLSKYGIALGRDNCFVMIEEKVINNLNDCGLGIILREFTAKDKYGNFKIDTQKIYVTNNLVLNKKNIDFPKDLHLENGCSYNVHPDSLPAGFNYPVFKGNGCTRVTWNYEDQEFIYVEEACRKIIRKWTVIDWCQFDYNNQKDGLFVDYQVIKISNSIAPTITSCGDQPAFEYLDECQVYATIIGKATDDCTPELLLKWKFKIDFNDDNTIDRSGTGNNASGVIPIGLHRLSWEVTDECGNVGYCDYLIEIEDNKAPSPVCLTDLVTVIMAPSGTIDIWASDFNKGSVDNCSNSSNLHFAFSADTLDAYKTIDCDMLDGNDRDTLAMDMYVIDLKGNFDYCTIHLIVQDNNNVCLDIELIEETTISGTIISPESTMISNVEIQLVSRENDLYNKVELAVSGEYAFQNVEMYQNYDVIPAKISQMDEGVSTLDIVKIQRHILGIKPFTSPYDFIAADVNNNGSVAASDIIQLRKLVLGIYEQFPDNSSWRFVDASHHFGDPEDIQEFPENINIKEINGPKSNNDFVGIKIGDVDHSHINRLKPIRTRSLVSLDYVTNTEGDGVKFEFSTTEENIVGFQFAINFDPELLEFVDIQSGNAILDGSNFYINSKDEEVINFSWNSTDGPKSGNALFSLYFRKKETVNNLDLHLDPSGLSAEIYTVDNSIITAKTLQLIKNDFAPNDFSLLQNIPNPFQQTTKIGYTLSKDEKVQLNVYDLTGRILFQRSIMSNRGHNEVSIYANELGVTGVLYYRIETSSGALSRKMIVIN